MPHIIPPLLVCCYTQQLLFNRFVEWLVATKIMVRLLSSPQVPERDGDELMTDVDSSFEDSSFIYSLTRFCSSGATGRTASLRVASVLYHRQCTA
jgi:hypothetical protein